MKTSIFILAFILLSISGFSQSAIRGKVKQKNGVPIFAANVYCKSDYSNGATTDFEGSYELKISENCDTLCFSFVGYNKKCVSVEQLKKNSFVVILEEQDHLLNEVLVEASDPISEDFAVIKVQKMDIYQNPVSAGDPLRAITSLPYSTNADETANPALRGSSADRSRVIVNGVPIRNPVRNGQLNGLGNFSLFNSEIVDKMYVYASNPPLTYGNTTAGLVEIETIKEINESQYQISASLANVGLFASQKMGSTSFLQAYGNYQFSKPFLKLNNPNFPHLKDFKTKDAGLNLRIKTGEKSYLNSFSYGIDESYDYQTNLFSYEGLLKSNKRRGFTINNWSLASKKGFMRINSLIDASEQFFSLGNLKSDFEKFHTYTSIDKKQFFGSNFSLQFGANFQTWNYQVKNDTSVYYYAIHPSAPSNTQDTTIHQENLEAYTYLTWDVNPKWKFSAGLRSNIPLFEDHSYTSYQASITYQPNESHRLLLSGGKYHNYRTLNFTELELNLLKSHQLALDYTLDCRNFNLTSAVFYKVESGKNITANFLGYDKIKTMGLELFLRKEFSRKWIVTLANTFLDQKIYISDQAYNSPNNFDYLTKLTIQYNNPSFASMALTYITRPGKYYASIVTSIPSSLADIYEPIFEEQTNSSRYENYNTLNFTCNRYFPLKKYSMVAFVSINNLLNTNNQMMDRYNSDYSIRFFDLYQKRSIYFGCVFYLRSNSEK